MNFKDEGYKSKLISVGDIVIGNSKGFGDSNNPYEGVKGTVTKIGYGTLRSMGQLMAITSSEFLKVTVDYNDSKKYEVFLYMVDLFERDQRNSESLDKGELICIGDRVQVDNPEHNIFGKSGFVRAIYNSDGVLNYDVRDDDVLKSSNELLLQMQDIINTQVDEKYNSDSEFEMFLRNIQTKNPELYEIVLKEGWDTDYIFKQQIYYNVTNRLTTEHSESIQLQKKIDELDKTNIFSVDASSVTLIKPTE